MGESLNIGKIGVLIFVTISGALLYISLKETEFTFKNVWSFYYKKVVRLYPALWMSFAVFIIADPQILQYQTLRLWLIQLSGTTVYFINIATPEFYDYSARNWFFWRGLVNPISWFVSMIIGLYIMYPIIHNLINKNKYFSFLTMLGAGIVSVVSHENHFTFGSGNPLPYLMFFVFGVYIAKNGLYIKSTIRTDSIIVFLSSLSFYVFLVHGSLLKSDIFQHMWIFITATLLVAAGVMYMDNLIQLNIKKIEKIEVIKVKKIAYLKIVMVMVCMLIVGLCISGTYGNSNPTIIRPGYSFGNLTVNYTPNNLGINLPWLDMHDGNIKYNWLNTEYNSAIVDSDLAVIHKMGITKIRSFCSMEAIFDYENGKFIINKAYANNLDDFLNKAEKYNISVILVMDSGGDAVGNGTIKDLDGNFHWDLIQTSDGVKAYTNAYIDYVNRFKNHKNILMWEIMNEGYGSLIWNSDAKELHVTQAQVHTFLVQSYQEVKRLAGDVPVGFSDYEEEQEPIFQIYSNTTQREMLVDDCTDIYSMHIYRNNASQVGDLSNIINKPKWVVELGAYNYYDPNMTYHISPGNNELLDTDKNFIATTQISKKLLDTGFTLIMPWAFTSNNGMVVHNPDGSYTLLELPQFMEYELRKLGR
jgi:hypothetical protein